MKIIIAVLAVCGLFLFGGCVSGGSDTGSASAGVNGSGGESKGPVIVLNTEKGKTEIPVDIADTSEERSKGLMYRESIPENYGMFFVFEEERERNFWMKNTLVPLDMIFFDGNYKVVNIVHNARPCKKDPCRVYPSEKPAKYVLEVNGGKSDGIGLKEGDVAQLNI